MTTLTTPATLTTVGRFAYDDEAIALSQSPTFKQDVLDSDDKLNALQLLAAHYFYHIDGSESAWLHMHQIQLVTEVMALTRQTSMAGTVTFGALLNERARLQAKFENWRHLEACRRETAPEWS